MENEPTLVEIAIYSLLKLRPDTMYVTPDGNHMYVLAATEDGDGLLNIEYIHSEHGRRFNEMTEDELNDVLVSFIEDQNS